jgi:hypothetical protein
MRSTRLEKPSPPLAAVAARTSPGPMARRAPAPPGPALQRMLGNHLYGQLLQQGLRVGPPGDRFEQEADRVADAVVSPSGSVRASAGAGVGESVQRRCTDCSEEARLQRTPLVEGQGFVDEELELDGQNGILQRSAEGPGSAPAGLSKQIAGTQGSGQPLPEATRRELGGRMGADFSGVRVHHDAAAAAMSRELNARAFTVGRDIYFGNGRYEPESTAGKHLLAHELTHTLQQPDYIRRLSITPTKSFTQGSCGERSVYWNFESGVAAPASGGYIVQHVRNLETIENCPSDVRSISTKPTDQFWEAWWVAPGDTMQEIHKKGVVDFTDRSFRPAAGGVGKSGTQVSLGTVKFFGKDTTGDLGKEDVLSSDAAIAANWKPGTKGGVAKAGWLPSTRSQPSWWDKALDGPATRWANSWWNCCGEASKHWSKSDAMPRSAPAAAPGP